MKMEGYEVVEKKAEAGGNSARIYVPKHWIGKKPVCPACQKKFTTKEELVANLK